MPPKKKVPEAEPTPTNKDPAAESPPSKTPPDRLTDLLSLNDQERGITPEDSEDVKWNYLSGAMYTKKILTGVVSGVETLQNGSIACAIDYEGVRILIPGHEMFMDSWGDSVVPPVPYQMRLHRMLGASVNFQLSVVDFINRAAVGSRRAAMKILRARYYASGRIKPGVRVACRVVGVGSNRATLEAFGVDADVLAGDLTWQWFSDVTEVYATGDLVVARVMDVQQDTETGNYHVRLSVKAASENPDIPTLKRLVPGSSYFGVVTGVRNRLIFIRLQTGANAKTMTYRTKEIPAKLDTVCFLVRSVDLEQGTAFGLVTRVIKRHARLR